MPNDAHPTWAVYDIQDSASELVQRQGTRESSADCWKSKHDSVKMSGASQLWPVAMKNV